jgi:hypothetical protein
MQLLQQRQQFQLSPHQQHQHQQQRQQHQQHQQQNAHSQHQQHSQLQQQHNHTGALDVVTPPRSTLPAPHLPVGPILTPGSAQAPAPTTADENDDVMGVLRLSPPPVEPEFYFGLGDRDEERGIADLYDEMLVAAGDDTNITSAAPPTPSQQPSSGCQ